MAYPERKWIARVKNNRQNLATNLFTNKNIKTQGVTKDNKSKHYSFVKFCAFVSLWRKLIIVKSVRLYFLELQTNKKYKVELIPKAKRIGISGLILRCLQRGSLLKICKSEYEK